MSWHLPLVFLHVYCNFDKNYSKLLMFNKYISYQGAPLIREKITAARNRFLEYCISFYLSYLQINKMDLYCLFELSNDSVST